MKEYFKISASKYDPDKRFVVTRPSSLNHPKDHSVMFVTKEYMAGWRAALRVKDCIVIWPEDCSAPDELSSRHAVIRHKDPRLGFALFFRENHVTCYRDPQPFELVSGAYVCRGARIGSHTKLFPGAYIDSEVTVGRDCYIGAGVKLLGPVRIGDDVIIRENTVIGSDGLTTRRDAFGKAVTIPQFGGVIIGDHVQIGACVVIARGAIDDTEIRSGCRIDNQCFISHNVQLGEDTMVVGETILFGSSSTGARAFISGNSAVRDGCRVGADAFAGMGSNITRDIPDGASVKGNPAR